jgi:hypothetical protein
MAWQSVGEYLGIEVRVQSVAVSSEFDAGRDLSSSVLLLVLGDPGDDTVESEERRALLVKIFRFAPLAMVFFGWGAQLAWDYVIRLPPVEPAAPHTMTSAPDSNDLVEAIEELLQATLPAEERFDEWKTYSILVVGDHNLSNATKAAIQTILG